MAHFASPCSKSDTAGTSDGKTGGAVSVPEDEFKYWEDVAASAAKLPQR